MTVVPGGLITPPSLFDLVPQHVDSSWSAGGRFEDKVFFSPFCLSIFFFTIICELM